MKKTILDSKPEPIVQMIKTRCCLSYLIMLPDDITMRWWISQVENKCRINWRKCTRQNLSLASYTSNRARLFALKMSEREGSVMHINNLNQIRYDVCGCEYWWQRSSHDLDVFSTFSIWDALKVLNVNKVTKKLETVTAVLLSHHEKQQNTGMNDNSQVTDYRSIMINNESSRKSIQMVLVRKDQRKISRRRC